MSNYLLSLYAFLYDWHIIPLTQFLSPTIFGCLYICVLPLPPRKLPCLIVLPIYFDVTLWLLPQPREQSILYPKHKYNTIMYTIYTQTKYKHKHNANTNLSTMLTQCIHNGKCKQKANPIANYRQQLM